MVNNKENHRREKNNTYFKAFWGTIIVFCLLLVTPISAITFSNNTFNDSLTTDNLNFISVSNITKYLSIPSSVSSLTSATISFNVSNGFENATGYWNFNNNFIDRAGPFDITTSIGANFTSDGYKLQGRDYNGSGKDSFIANDSLDIEFGPGVVAFSIKVEPTAVDAVFIEGAIPGPTRQNWVDLISGKTRFLSGTPSPFTPIKEINDSLWHRVVWTRNTTNERIYIDGVVDSTRGASGGGFRAAAGSELVFGGKSDLTGPFNGSLDEIIILKATGWTDEEVLQDYAKIRSVNNFTFFINNTDTGFSIAGDYNESLITFSGFITAINSYISSCPIVNGTCNVPFVFGGGIGSIRYLNLNVSNTGFIENSQTFNATTVETSTESFILNFTYDTGEFPFVSANLNYNGTIVAGTDSGSGTEAIFTASLDIPAIDTTSELVPFVWEITLTNSSGSSSKVNSTINTQNVTELTIVDCSGGGTPILNFTAASEANLTAIDPFTIEATFEFFIGSGSVKQNVTIPSEVVSSKSICVTPGNVNVTTTGIVTYFGAGNTSSTYSQRDYNFELNSFGNVTTNVTLFLLEVVDSTSFIIKVQDQNLIPIVDALVLIERFYPGLNEFRTVQVARTDDNGQSIGFYKVETVDYRHTIIKEGVQLLRTSKQKIFAESSPAQLTFTVGDIITDPILTFEDIELLDATLVYNVTSGLVTFTYVDSSGNFSSSGLVVEQVNLNAVNSIVCNESSASSSATLVCDVSSLSGTFTAQGLIARSPFTVAKAIIFKITDIIDTMGEDGLLLAWIIILVAAMIGIWNPTVGIILVNVVVFLVNIIGLASFGPIYLFSMVAASIVLIILLKT